MHQVLGMSLVRYCKSSASGIGYLLSQVLSISRVRYLVSDESGIYLMSQVSDEFVIRYLTSLVSDESGIGYQGARCWVFDKHSIGYLMSHVLGI